MSYLFANVYSSFSPVYNTASAVCLVNGVETACGPWLTTLGIGLPVIMFLAIAFLIVTSWKLYTKAGQPGWASIIPIYNIVVMLQIVRKPIWWIILMFIPLVNLIVGLVVLHNLSKVFGRGFGFTLGLIILPIIFYPILAFGSATYNAPSPQSVQM